MEMSVTEIDQTSCRPQEVIEDRLARFAPGSINFDKRFWIKYGYLNTVQVKRT